MAKDIKYKLQVFSKLQDLSKSQQRQSNVALDEAVRELGLVHGSLPLASDAASIISKLEGVNQVTVLKEATEVQGCWRKGLKA